jgi:NAD(P)-dependent dehydrogenase (short-subunit alcohol dehydrogenase family)
MWDKVIALNLTAPAVVSGRAIKQWLKEGKKGSIVNIASIAGFRGFTCGMSARIALSVKMYFRGLMLTPHTRRRIHGQQARFDRPYKKHRRVLRFERYSL